MAGGVEEKEEKEEGEEDFFLAADVHIHTGAEAHTHTPTYLCVHAQEELVQRLPCVCFPPVYEQDELSPFFPSCICKRVFIVHNLVMMVLVHKPHPLPKQSRRQDFLAVHKDAALHRCLATSRYFFGPKDFNSVVINLPYKNGIMI